MNIVLNVILEIIAKLAMASNLLVEVRNDLHGDTKNKKADVVLRVLLTMAGACVDTLLRKWMYDTVNPWFEYSKSLALSSAIFISLFDYAINFTMDVDGAKRPVLTYISKGEFDSIKLWVAIGWKGRLLLKFLALACALTYYFQWL